MAPAGRNACHGVRQDCIGQPSSRNTQSHHYSLNSAHTENSPKQSYKQKNYEKNEKKKGKGKKRFNIENKDE